MNSIEQYSILEVYKLLLDFCSGIELSEDRYSNLLYDLSVFEISLTDNMYRKIHEFCEKEIEPEIDKQLEIDFTIEEAEEIDGVINIKTQEAEKKLLSAYMKQSFDLEDKIRDFGESVLKPYLLA